MLNKRWITLPVAYCRPFVSREVLWAILKDFDFFRFLFLIIEGQGRNPCLERAPAPERFSSRKSHRFASKLRCIKVERFTLLLVPSDRKSIQKVRSPRRKLKSHSFWTVKMHSKNPARNRLRLIGCLSLTKWLTDNNWFKRQSVGRFLTGTYESCYAFWPSALLKRG